MTAAALPPPMLPASCDLRKFPDMPLDVNRLRKSETRVRTKPEEFRAAIMLWCAAWHEVPAGSVPDDDIGLSDLAGYGVAVKEWKRVRAGALRGFVRCSDGRLYHPVIVSKAIHAWRSLLERRHETECGRLKKEYQRHRTPEQDRRYPTFDLWISENCPEAEPFMSLGTGETVPRDKKPRPPDTVAVSPGKTPLTDRIQNNEDLSDHRFPGVEDIPAVEPKAADAPPPDPTVEARVVEECTRAQLEHASSGNTMIQRWISHGATPMLMANALADARRTMPTPKVLTCAYVDPIIERMIKQDRETRAAAAASHKRTQDQIAEQAKWTASPPPDGLIRKRGAAAA